MRSYRFQFRIAPLWLFGALLAPVAAQAQNYQGYFDYASCASMYGWVWNGIDDTRVMVDIYDGSTYLQTVTADQNRPDVANPPYNDGWHGFSIQTPQSIINDGRTHTMHAYVQGSNPLLELTLSPKPAFNCVYNGFFDGASVSTFFGWAWRIGSDSPVSVDFLDGNTVVPPRLAHWPTSFART